MIHPVNVTLQDYVPKGGNKASKLPTKRELVGYVPMEKRVTDLLAAGLRTAAVRDARFFDGVDEDAMELPPMPRHMPADLAEVSELARQYALRRAEIEKRVRKAREELKSKSVGGTPTVGSPEALQASGSGPAGGSAGG